MQLEYTKAHQHLLTAIRKAPQQTAIGFRQNVNDKIAKKQQKIIKNIILGT